MMGKLARLNRAVASGSRHSDVFECVPMTTIKAVVMLCDETQDNNFAAGVAMHVNRSEYEQLLWQRNNSMVGPAADKCRSCGRDTQHTSERTDLQ